jgi:hypothetical protein
MSRLYRGFKRLYMYRRPAHAKVLMRDWQRQPEPIAGDQEHLAAALDWLCRAQDVTGGGGVSAGYHLARGWRPAFPETTGYIISTFLAAADRLDVANYRQRALRMGNWEIDIQLDSGAVRGGVGLNRDPLVFDTGQVILGWVALFRATGRERYLEAAVRAADWLADIQDQDGGWSRHTFQGLARVYHARVAWAVLSVYDQTGRERFRHCGERHVKWVLSQATEKAWFRRMAFDDRSVPLTHTIAYTLRGLWECARLLNDEGVPRLVNRACDGIIECYRLTAGRAAEDGPTFLPATLDKDWNPGDDSYSCLTGNVQLALLWLKMYRAGGDDRYRRAARRLIRGVKAAQSLTSRDGAIRGSVPGSRPLGGGYLSHTYPNWAAKFLADALMEKMDLDRSIGKKS